MLQVIVWMFLAVIVLSALFDFLSSKMSSDLDSFEEEVRKHAESVQEFRKCLEQSRSG